MSEVGELTTVPIRDIRRDGGTQMRAQLDGAIVEEYAIALQNGTVFPPVVVFRDEEGALWLGDGFHRVEACTTAGYAEIQAEVRPGTRRDAVLHSASANVQHGLRPTNADKRRAVVTLLMDAEWSEWSDREIARRTGTSNTFVGKLRAELSVNVDRRIVKRGGTTYAMATTASGQIERVSFEALPEKTKEEILHTRLLVNAFLLSKVKPVPKDQLTAEQLEQLRAGVDATWTALHVDFPATIKKLEGMEPSELAAACGVSETMIFQAEIVRVLAPMEAKGVLGGWISLDNAYTKAWEDWQDFLPRWPWPWDEMPPQPGTKRHRLNIEELARKGVISDSAARELCWRDPPA